MKEIIIFNTFMCFASCFVGVLALSFSFGRSAKAHIRSVPFLMTGDRMIYNRIFRVIMVGWILYTGFGMWNGVDRIIANFAAYAKQGIAARSVFQTSILLLVSLWFLMQNSDSVSDFVIKIFTFKK